MLRNRQHPTRGLRPRLEILENRSCPSSNSLLDDGTLLIVDGRPDDVIAIRVNGGDDVAVETEESEPPSFTGEEQAHIRFILADAFDADDGVFASLPAIGDMNEKLRSSSVSFRRYLDADHFEEQDRQGTTEFHP